MKLLNARFFSIVTIASASVCPLVLRAAEEEAPADKPPEEYNNWVTLGIGHNWVSGNKANFQERNQVTEGLYGGLEDLHFESAFGKKGFLQLDARSILGDRDNLIRLELSEQDFGFVRFGFREYRTYYDASGGWFPLNDAWFEPFDDDRDILRSEIWFEAGLRLPDVPEVTFRYTHFTRDGDKGSTIWGDSNLTGAPPPNITRNIVPSLWDIDEERDLFELDVRHTLGNTDLGLGLRYELAKHDNTRYEIRRPGEPQERVVTHEDGYDSDVFNVHGFSITRFSDAVMFTLGYSFTTLDTDIFGSRIYGAEFDPVYDPLFARRQFRDEGFYDLEGGSQLKQHVANLSLMATPFESFRIIPSVRLEVQDQDGYADFIETAVGGPPTLTTQEFEILNTRERSIIDVVPSLELRYDGLTNWVFYAKGTWSAGQGDLTEREIETEEDGEVTVIYRDTDSERYTQKYAVGANWYPLRRVNFAAQYYHKVRENDYDHLADSTTNAPPSADRYPAYIVDQDFETDDVNFRVTLRPLKNLTLISRYDFQYSTVDSRMDYLSRIESAEIKSHIFGQTVSWAPAHWLYLQAGVNLVRDGTETPANFLTGTNANLVTEFDSDYITGTFLAGLALDQRTDLQLQYFYYRADNWKNNANVSQPYGADSEEHGISATLARQLTKQLRWKLRYAWYTNRDVTSGGHNDYDAHMVYTSLQYLF